MMSSYKSHLNVKNFDDDDNDEDEDLSDDEVFTRSNKSLCPDENGASKPLMAPRQKAKDGLKTKVRKVPSCRVIWASALYFLVTLSTIIGIICLVVFLINVFMKKVNKTESLTTSLLIETFMPCKKMSTQDVWIRTFPKLTTETAVRLNDVNKDGIEDIILGFGTGADAFSYPPVVCQVYFPDANISCGGGVLALDGKTGTEIWRHYSSHEIFALNCNVDLDRDGIKDCVAGGRMANFKALSGKTGKLLWDFTDGYWKIETSNIYTPQFVEDLDDDGVPDLVAIHGGDPLKKPGSKIRLVGRLMLVSGKSGKVLRGVQVPDQKESYYSPQVLVHPDGTQIVLFGTGGETHGGSLWCIKLSHLAKGDISKAQSFYTDDQKGIMTPPVLIDITGDGVLDIVMAMFNSTVVAFNGLTFAKIWTYHQPSSETYSTPGVGYFNNDSTPDFIINYQIGPGFPIYYYTLATILDGRNGMPLLHKPIKMVIGTQSSPLVISIDGRGNDIFMYWVADCHGSHNVSQLEFEFLKNTSVHEQSRADFCKLRFKQKMFTRLYALSSSMTPPGFVLYDSDRRKSVEYSNPINYTAMGLEFVHRHPEFREEYQQYLDILQGFDIQESVDGNSGNQYNSYRLQSMLNRPRNRETDMGNEGPYDQSEDYGMDDRPEEAGYYSPYYFQQKFSNLGNNLYEPSEYLRAAHRNHPRYNIAARNLQSPSRGSIWSQQGPNMLNNYFENQSKNYQKNQPLSARQKRRKLSKYKNKGTLENKRSQRHVSFHDGGGIQRIISTGTLAPPLNPNNGGIDVIFATFWFYPSEAQGLLREDKECIALGMKSEKERFNPKSQFFPMDHDAYEEIVIEECLRKSGHLNTNSVPISTDYNPFNRPMGQLTLYRLHLDCKCVTNGNSTNHCSNILPFESQRWPSYMGRYGDSVARGQH